MRGAFATLTAAAALVLSVSALAASRPATLTQARVVSSFKRQTGTALIVDRRASYPGHYAALGVQQSISNVGRFGHFTIWVVTSAAPEDAIRGLLVDPHTGELGTPGAAAIYWEHGTTIGGSDYWLAKKRYGANLVLWWYGSSRKTDASFRVLHRALTAIAATSR